MVDYPESVANEKEAESLLDYLVHFEQFVENNIPKDNWRDIAAFFLQFLAQYNDVFVRFQSVLNADPRRALSAYAALKNVQEKLKPLVQMPEILKKIPYKYEAAIKEAVRREIPEPSTAVGQLKGQEQAIVDELKGMASDLSFYKSKMETLKDEMSGWLGSKEGELFFVYEDPRTQIRNFIYRYNLKTDKLRAWQAEKLSREILAGKKVLLNDVLQKLEEYRNALTQLLTAYNAGLLNFIAKDYSYKSWNRGSVKALQQDIAGKLALLSRKFAIAA